MNKIPLLMLLLLLACNTKKSKTEAQNQWTEVKKTAEGFQILDCGYPPESIVLTQDSLIHNGVMEQLGFKINHIRQEKETSMFFDRTSENTYYQFSWQDKNKGIARWEIINGKSRQVKYFVNSQNFQGIPVLKGSDADCLTRADAEQSNQPASSSYLLLSIDDQACLRIRNAKKELLLEKCFENCTVRTRPAKGNVLSFTFISGSKSMDIDFYPEGTDWISKTATYYSDHNQKETKKTLDLALYLSRFDFGIAANAFEAEEAAKEPPTDLEGGPGVLQKDIYQIADLLKADPITAKNSNEYGNMARDLIRAEKYNEARLILLEVVKIAPNQASHYLDLADAQWGFEDQENAKKSYQKYILLMEKKPKEIPKRAWERVKR